MARIALIAILTALLAVPAAAETVNGIVAVVNDEVITQRQLDNNLSARGRDAAKARSDPFERRKVIEKMIDEKLMGQLLAKADIAVTEDDIANAIAGVLHQNGMTIAQLRAEVSSKGMAWEEYKKELETHIKRIKFINQVIGPQVKITDQDLRDYYRQNQERFRGSVSAHIAQIFIPFENFQSQADVEAFRDRAMEIASRARRGADFKELARKYSKGPNAGDGGDLGMVNVKDLPPEVGMAVKHMDTGDVTQPIAIDTGLLIVKVISLPELSASDFEKLRDDIYSALYDERIKETLDSYLQRERSKAYVEIM